MPSLLLRPSKGILHSLKSAFAVSSSGSRISVGLCSTGRVLSGRGSIDRSFSATSGRLMGRLQRGVGCRCPCGRVLGLHSGASISTLTGGTRDSGFTFATAPSFVGDNGVDTARENATVRGIVRCFSFSGTSSVSNRLSELCR